jgi:hypothetical protein
MPFGHAVGKQLQLAAAQEERLGERLLLFPLVGVRIDFLLDKPPDDLAECLVARLEEQVVPSISVGDRRHSLASAVQWGARA